MVAVGAHVHVRKSVRAGEHDRDSDADVHVSGHRPHHDTRPGAVPAPRVAVADHHDLANLHDTDRTVEHAAQCVEHALDARVRVCAAVLRAAIEHDHRNARVPGRSNRQPIAVHRLRHHRHHDARLGLPVARRAGDLHRQHHDAKPLRARVRVAIAFDANAMRRHAAIRCVPGGDDGRLSHVPTRRHAERDVRGADRFRHVGRMVDHDDAVQRVEQLRFPSTSALRPHAEPDHHAVRRMPGEPDGLAAIAHLFGKRVRPGGRSHILDVRRMDARDRAAQLLAARVPATASKLHCCDRRLYGVRRVHRCGSHVFLHGNESVPFGVQRLEHELQEHVARRSGRRVRYVGSVAGFHARVRVYGQSAELYVADRADRADVPCTVREHAADGAVGPRRDVSGLGLAADRSLPVVLMAEPAEHDACVSVGRKSNGRHLGSRGDVSELVVQRRRVRATATAVGRIAVHHALARCFRRPVRHAVRWLRLRHLPRADAVRGRMPTDGRFQRVHHQARGHLQHQRRHLQLLQPIAVDHRLADHRPDDPDALHGRQQHLQPNLQRNAARGGEIPADRNHHHHQLLHRLRTVEQPLKPGDARSREKRAPSSAHPWACDERPSSAGRARSNQPLPQRKARQPSRRPFTGHLASTPRRKETVGISRDDGGPRRSQTNLDGARGADASDGCAARKGARGKPCSTMFRPPLVATGSGSGAALLFRRAVLGSRIPRYPTRKRT